MRRGAFANARVIASGLVATVFFAAIRSAAFWFAPSDGLGVFLVAEFAGTAVVAKVFFARIALKRLVFVKIRPRRIIAARIVIAALGFVNLGSGFAGLDAEVGRDGLGLNLALAQSGQIIGYGFFFIEADLAGVGADKTFVEDAAGKLVKVFFFDGAQHAGADFGGVGDSVELDAALLALFAKFFSERTHGGLRRAGLGFRPHRDA
jgi:hypothetical protein